MRKMHDKNVNKARILSDFNKNIILIERDMKFEFKNIDKLFDEIKFKTIYEKQNHESFNKSFSSFRTLLSQTRFVQSDFKRKMYVFMKSTTKLLI